MEEWKLTSFNAKISNGALKGKNLPTRLKILNWGNSDSTQGKVVLNDETVRVFEVNQKKIGRDKDVPIDFDHNSVPGSSEYIAGEPKRIAGYGDPVLIKGDGLYLENIRWTEDGLNHAEDYIDLSPAIMDKNGIVQALHSVALTPTGSVYDLKFYNENNIMKKLSSDQKNPSVDETILSENENIPHTECLCKLCTAKKILSTIEVPDKDDDEEEKTKTKTMNAIVTIPDAYKAIPQQYKNMNDSIIKKMAAIAGIEGETDAEKVLNAFLAKYEGLVAEHSEQITKKENTEDGGLKQFNAKFEALETEIKALKKKSIPMSSNMRVLSVDSNKKVTREDTVAKFNAMLGNK
jgi:hypothetical protein